MSNELRKFEIWNGTVSHRTTYWERIKILPVTPTVTFFIDVLLAKEKRPKKLKYVELNFKIKKVTVGRRIETLWNLRSRILVSCYHPTLVAFGFQIVFFGYILFSCILSCMYFFSIQLDLMKYDMLWCNEIEYNDVKYNNTKYYSKKHD